MRLELFPATLTEKSAVFVEEQGMNTLYKFIIYNVLHIQVLSCCTKYFFEIRFVSTIDKHIIHHNSS